jgi:hypothetical protein
MLPAPGAIADAVHDAVGVWVDDLPLTSERVLAALGVLDAKSVVGGRTTKNT